MLSDYGYLLLPIFDSLSLTIFLKLALTCKNFFLLLVVVRLVIFLRHPFLVIGHSLSSHVTFYIMCHPGHENFYNCALCCLLLLLMVTLDLSLLTCLSWPTTLHMSLFKCHSEPVTLHMPPMTYISWSVIGSYQTFSNNLHGNTARCCNFLTFCFSFNPIQRRGGGENTPLHFFIKLLQEGSNKCLL